MARKANVSGAMKVKITRDLLAKALTWHCPYYTRQGFASCCDTGDGHPTNCSGPAQLCTRVTDIFKTMTLIQKGEIEVW